MNEPTQGQPTPPPSRTPDPAQAAAQTQVPPHIAEILASMRPGPYGLGPGIPAGQLTLPIPQLLAQQTTQVWQGQYPPPEAVERYEKILPGTFNRMITMAEQAQDLQFKETAQANRFLHRDVQRGHWLGWSATVLAMGLSIVALAYGSTVVALGFLSVPVMSVGRALIQSAKREFSPATPPESMPPPPNGQ